MATILQMKLFNSRVRRERTVFTNDGLMKIEKMISHPRIKLSILKKCLHVSARDDVAGVTI